MLHYTVHVSAFENLLKACGRMTSSVAECAYVPGKNKSGHYCKEQHKSYNYLSVLKQPRYLITFHITPHMLY